MYVISIVGPRVRVFSFYFILFYRASQSPRSPLRIRMFVLLSIFRGHWCLPRSLIQINAVMAHLPPPSYFAHYPWLHLDRGQDLLIGYRVYHPDGDFEEAVNEDHEPRGEASLVPGTYVSTDARRKELDAMAAAATLGGLARRGRAEVAVAVAGGPHEAGDGIMEDAAVYMDPILDLDLAEPALRDAGGDIASVEAPAAGGLGIVGRLRGRGQGGAPGRVAISDGLGVELGQGVRGPGMIHRYFGLALPNEWIPASSSRIEKLNSKASWGRSWTEEVIYMRKWFIGTFDIIDD